MRTKLQSPPPEARGWTRWWWYGCAVTREDISLQLTAMRDAHIGGVEIQITYPLDVDRQAPPRTHIDFFSPAFFDILAYTVETAKGLGMAVDLTLGSGWPFGGPFITQDMAPVCLMPFSHDVQGPTRFSFDYTCVLPGKIARSVLVRMENGVMLPETARDVTDCLEPVALYGWPWGYRLADVEVPEGLYKIYTFVEGRYRQTVGIPSPGMEGFAIDHCRKDVCDLYFSTLGDTLVNKLGRGALHGFFCDSIELGGNNWTGSLPEAFEARRGYALTPYLPALWGDMGDVTPRVRYDYYRTFSELTLESFFENFTAHCERLGVRSRVQAHGIWADILKAYGAAHIPEGETFGPHDRYDVNTIHRRLAVSAGMVYGRPIVSNESFTWLRMPRFLVTPAMVKRAVDAIFCDGVNRIVNHGWSYSPADEPAPGWPFYASTMLSSQNTWWSYYPALGAYIHRVSALMQAGSIHSEVAVYLPQADVWSDSPMAELHMCMKLDAYLGHEATNLLQRKGFWFTYVNDEAIEGAEMTAQGMRVGENTYRAVLLMGCRRLPTATARGLERFVKAGGALLAVEDYPRQGVGLQDWEAKDLAVKAAMDALFMGAAGVWRNVGNGKAAIAPSPDTAMTDLLAEAVTPDLCSDMDEDLGYIRRTVEGKPVYLLANMADRARTARLSLPHPGEGFSLLDGETGETILPLSVEDEAGRLRITVPFLQNQSMLLEIGGERPALSAPASAAVLGEVAGWSLTVAGERLAEGMPRPVGWETFPLSRYHCGEGVYEARFTVDSPEGLGLRLEGFDCCAEVFVNGVSAARLWKAPYEADISAAARPGENALRIVAVNTWINDFLNPDRPEPAAEEAVIDQWPYFTKIVDQARARRIYGWREREMVREPQPSGLRGPVWLLKQNAKGE